MEPVQARWSLRQEVCRSTRGLLAQVRAAARRPGSRSRLIVGAVVAACLAAAPALASPGGTVSDSAQADAILRIVRNRMASDHLRAVLVRVTIDGQDVVTEALGESMTGVPATRDMHVRNGAIAISYVATLLLQLVDEKRVSLDDKLSRWLPEIPNAHRVTLGQLARMTSGYRDYVIGNPAFEQTVYANPFRQFTPQELLSYANLQSLWYEPGTSWNYAHTNYILLGLALEKITGMTIPQLMQERIFAPCRYATRATLTAHPGSPSPCFTPSRRSGASCLASHHPRASTRSRPTGIRRGRSRGARSNTRPSPTW